MKISVIIPVYNVEEYLDECLESVLSQNYRDLEIILVNDGSTDNSKAICEAYIKNNKNIKLINKVNTGLSDTRNIGIKNSSGEYLVFLDSDDFWEVDFLSEIESILNKNDEFDMIFFRMLKFYDDNKELKEEKLLINENDIINKDGKSILKSILKKNKYFEWYACRFIIKKDFLLKNNLYFEVGRSYEDALWSPKVFLNASKVYYYDKAIYNYRLNRAGQITSNVSKKNIIDSIFVTEYWIDQVKKYDIKEDLRIMLIKNLAVRYFYGIWFNYSLPQVERNYIIKKLNKNREMLKYVNGKRELITSIIIKFFGFNIGSKIYKYIIDAKRLIKNN